MIIKFSEESYLEAKDYAGPAGPAEPADPADSYGHHFDIDEMEAPPQRSRSFTPRRSHSPSASASLSDAIFKLINSGSVDDMKAFIARNSIDLKQMIFPVILNRIF